MNKNEQLEAILSCLNQAYKDDEAAMHALVANRIPCNQQLADHPTIQVSDNKVCAGFNVGCLGIINGVLAAAGIPLVAAKWVIEEEGKPNKFVGFCEYKAPILD